MTATATKKFPFHWQSHWTFMSDWKSSTKGQWNMGQVTEIEKMEPYHILPKVVTFLIWVWQQSPCSGRPSWSCCSHSGLQKFLCPFWMTKSFQKFLSNQVNLKLHPNLSLKCGCLWLKKISIPAVLFHKLCESINKNQSCIESFEQIVLDIRLCFVSIISGNSSTFILCAT